LVDGGKEFRVEGEFPVELDICYGHGTADQKGRPVCEQANSDQNAARQFNHLAEPHLGEKNSFVFGRNEKSEKTLGAMKGHEHASEYAQDGIRVFGMRSEKALQHKSRLSTGVGEIDNREEEALHDHQRVTVKSPSQKPFWSRPAATISQVRRAPSRYFCQYRCLRSASCLAPFGLPGGSALRPSLASASALLLGLGLARALSNE
jgi:hypothetical protein